MLKITCSPELIADIFTSRTINSAHVAVQGLPEGARLVSANPKIVYENHWSTSVEWDLIFSHPDSPDNVVEEVALSLSVQSEDC